MVKRALLRFPRWSDGVTELLKHAGTPVAAIAKELAVNRTIVHRYLSGERSVSGGDVVKINRAVAKTIGYDEIENYLGSLAACEGIELDAESFGDALEQSLSDVLKIASRDFLRDDARHQIYQIIINTPPEQQYQLLLAVNAFWRKRLIRKIDGVVPKYTFIIEICELFALHGIELNNWFRPENEINDGILGATFELKVQEALATSGLAVQTRINTEVEILSAFWMLRAVEKLQRFKDIPDVTFKRKKIRESISDLEKAQELLEVYRKKH